MSEEQKVNMEELKREKLEKFFRVQEEKQKKKKEKERMKNLHSRGLTVLKKTRQSEFAEYVPLELTDEEYKQIMKYESNKFFSKSNIIKSLYVAGWVIIGFSSLIGFTVSVETDSIMPLIISVGGAIMSALIFFAFARNLEILEDIKEELKDKDKE